MKKHETSRAGKQKVTVSDLPNSSQHTQPSAPAFPAHHPKPAPSASLLRQPGNPHPPNAQKVAIPRLRRPSEDHSILKLSLAGDKNRVAHACEPCRHRKTKCSGERPICQHCQDFKLTCVYEDGKRDRTKKQLGSLAGRVENYERLLEDLSLRAGDHDQQLIRKALDQEQSSDDDDASSVVSPRGRTKFHREQAGEHRVSARVGSTESLDRISEDFNRDANTRATGFYGKNSELTWMQRLKRQASHGSEDSDEYEQERVNEPTPPSTQSHHFGTGLTPISASSYHCDDLTVLIHEQIDPFELPTQFIANNLFQAYLETVHPSFPIIGKNTFMQQYNAFFANPDQVKPNQNWWAILNMIFAIAAKHSHLVRAVWRGDSKDHLIYFTRARMLGFNADAILGHSELQKVQVTGLMAFYLMAVNQINRSWAVSGIAIRHACTLGLNLRNESKDVSDASKEIRYRVWWALCSVERVLAVMTGRPTSFAETDCTAPLPLPLEEDSFFGPQPQSPQAVQMFRRWSSQESGQSEYAMPTPTSSIQSSKKQTSSATSVSPAGSQQSSQDRKQPCTPCNALAFSYHTKLSTFTNEVLNRLYRAATMSESWAQVQGTISNLNAKLETWRLQLPPIFDFTKKQRDQQFVTQRMSLGFFYYSTLTIINRPCLCRIDRKIPDESDKAKEFNRETAARCVHAARDMLDLLPDEPNAIGLYKIGPWWCLVHYLMQAATVLMLELSFRADHMPMEVEEVFDSAKKALEWLRSMSEEDEAARRASVLCNELLRRVAPKVGRSPDDASNFQPGGMNPIQSIEDMQNMQDPQAGPTALSPNQAQYGYTTSAPFQPQMFTSYDQFLTYGQLPTTSAAEPFDEMFPTANEMDGMSFEEPEPPGNFPGHNHQWLSGSGV